MDLEYSVSLLHKQPNFSHYPGTREGLILILSMRTFCTGSVNACSTQAEHEFIISPVWKDLSGGTIEHLIIPSIHREASMSLHASPA